MMCYGYQRNAGTCLQIRCVVQSLGIVEYQMSTYPLEGYRRDMKLRLEVQLRARLEMC